MERRIETLVRSLGIGATYRGYRYLCFGLGLCVADEEYVLYVTKLLYPQIACEFCTNPSNVERDIRTIIKVCWDRGNKQYLQQIALYPLYDRPTSGEFMDILSSYLKSSSE